MDEKSKALSDVTGTPTLANFGGGAPGMSRLGPGLISPAVWAQTPPVLGPGGVPASGTGFGTGLMDGFSPLFAAGTSGMASGMATGMTPFAEMVSPGFYYSASPELTFNPAVPAANGQQGQSFQSMRKNAIRSKFQNVFVNNEERAAHSPVGELDSTPVTTSPLPDQSSMPTPTPPSGKHACPSPIGHVFQPTKGQTGQLQPANMYQHMQGSMGMAGYPIPAPSHSPGMPYDPYVMHQKQEPMYAHDYRGQQMRQYPGYPPEFYYPAPPMHARMKPEIMYVPQKQLAPPAPVKPVGAVIAKKGGAEEKAAREEITDKKLLKQIRSRDAASRQRSRQKTYLQKMEQENRHLKDESTYL
eukprot:CAMPEP_0198724068 /NCGR_PEP_ID=MMETSP1475-20131203/1567_1 /TAXON_ID= ORGANISM="Unidentified sp., Strain CCMP1999" /NCGR_SAMPLE_ID=MMETSP1475 /ASSEMBLY_ACC=CAM_ASM_001111 /LENGTH=356 /DNA_ID=CAMNT_0044485461 /DNA_START=172 /DNA_END=1243 /DNA_ORIENTATION=-